MYESGEMYLETIYTLGKRMDNVRAVNISEEMNFSKPSVSRAVSKLRNEGFIVVDGNGYITLTESGLAVAGKIYERHQVISQMLISIGVDEKVAVRDACKIEHDISEETFEVIKAHYKGKVK